MASAFSEKDWLYMKSVREELLVALCGKINRACAAILASQGETEHARYLRLYTYIGAADEIVAECFDDWKRSGISQKACSLHRHGLLTAAHLEQLSPAARNCITIFASLLKRKT